MAKKNYDANLIVIGAGSGGLVTAYIGAAIKAKVILIEKGKMGGDCLNTGCVPSKSLIACAKLIHDIQHADKLGLKAKVAFDFAEIMQRVQSVIKQIEPHDSVERYTELGVQVIQGTAKITGENHVEVNGEIFTANSIVIATGAEPFVPDIAGIEEIGHHTSDTIWEIRELPKRLVILGGGPLGCELAQCFARFGSEVSLIERKENILGREDAEFSQAITQVFRSEGINVLTDHTANKIIQEGGQKKIFCQNKSQEVIVEFDQILVALGRSARIENYGLDNLNIPLTPSGTIQCNDYLQAGYNNIYVVGDVTGPYQFTHSAAHQAWYASVNALFRPFKKFKVDYSILPWVTYTAPEIARVGLNEMDAKQKGILYEVTTYDISELDRAITEGSNSGLVKVLTVPGKDKILGVTIMCENAGELISEFVLAMQHGLGLNKILRTIHAYPTWAEANKFLAGNWKKNHVPEWALNLLKRFHQFRRR